MRPFAQHSNFEVILHLGCYLMTESEAPCLFIVICNAMPQKVGYLVISSSLMLMPLTTIKAINAAKMVVSLPTLAIFALRKRKSYNHGAAAEKSLREFSFANRLNFS